MIDFTFLKIKSDLAINENLAYSQHHFDMIQDVNFLIKLSQNGTILTNTKIILGCSDRC
ncbi:MAG: hypothetical protein F6K22_13840 [Okeania sp. SIO2F4]|nr:hypothetical protein [Okeania sp. SIO2F4]